MPEAKPPEGQLWESGWESHTLEQRQRLARLSLAEKLAWLEEAQRLVARFSRKPPRGKPGPKARP